MELIELCALSAPPGFEQNAAEHIHMLIKPYMTETWIDTLGNVIGVRKCGKEQVAKLLFDAHIDEPGMIITGSEDGFLRFAALGGVDARSLPASEVLILTDPPTYGVIAAMPPHLTKKEDADKFAKIEDMLIDIGRAESDVPIGTPAVFTHGARVIDNMIFGKALDNRAGVFAVLRALELLRDVELHCDLYVMFSVQEEVGTRGAGTGAFAIEPDYCVVIDAGHAKTPDSKPSEVQTELGKGVIISRGPNMNRAFTERVVKLAVTGEVAHQIDVEPGGNSGTNARVIQTTCMGISTALLSIPIRYMHCSHEVASLDDIDSAVKLLCGIAKECGQ